MVMYATASELASYLQQDVDTSTATLVLTLASGQLSQEAGTWWTPQTVTYSQVGTRNCEIVLPYDPVTAVSAVRVNGVAVTGWTLLPNNTLYRAGGFGTPNASPPDRVDIDLTYGYSAVTDDVKAAVLETAAQAYSSPDPGATSERIDDYSVGRRAEASGVQLSPYARDVAKSYRIPAVA